MTSIRKLLTSGSDSDLCGHVVTRIIEVHGKNLDASKIPKEHRTALLVWHSMGIIGNGGFNYLFECSFDGDPFYALTAEAFRDIGCKPAADAFQRALNLFPNSQPPTDLDRRLQIYRRGGGAERGKIDEQFWRANDEIDRCTANYIRTNRQHFEPLDSAPNKPMELVATVSASEPSEVEMLIAQLPHWARIAYAAHCARSVFPLFHASWPNAPQRRRASLITAIVAAEKSANEASAADNIDDIRLETGITAGAALGGLYGVPEGHDTNVPPDGNMASIASHAARAAEEAATAAKATVEQSTIAALEAVRWAFSTADDDPKVTDQMRNNLERLLTIAERENWLDETAVPPSVFDRWR